MQVNDLLSRRRLGQASVEVFVNHSRTQAVLTGEDGGVSLRVPLPAGPSVTVVASKDGYVSTQLPCITDRSPGQIRNACETLSTAQTKLRPVKIHFNMTFLAPTAFQPES